MQSAYTKEETDLLNGIEKLSPLIRSRAEKTRELRKVDIITIGELQDIGFFKALQPKAFKGLEISPSAFFKAQTLIAEACMSTAWASGIIAVHAFQIALMDKKAQHEVWDQNINARISSSYAPLGKVEKVEDGFKLSGRWGWSSGCDHCSWVLLGAIVPEDGYRTFLLPASDYQIVDAWYSMGLQGTGSNDIVVKDAFVPEHRTHKQMDGFNLTNPGVDENSSYIYRIPWAQIFIRVVSTPAIGAAKDAIALYKGIVAGKQSMDITKHSQDSATLERISRAYNEIAEMEVVLEHNFNLMLSNIANGHAISLKDRALYRYQASLVIDKCIGIVDSLFSMAGGRSVFLGSEIQQRFLDIHTARAHVANNPVAFERNLGSLLLGGENADYFI